MPDDNFTEFDDSIAVRKHLVFQIAKVVHAQEKRDKEYYGGPGNGGRTIGCREVQENHEADIKVMKPTVKKAKSFFGFFASYWKYKIITVPATLFCLLGFLFFIGLIGMNTHKTNKTIQVMQGELEKIVKVIP